MSKKTFELKVWWASIRFMPAAPDAKPAEGWANVVAWNESDAEEKIRDHYGVENVQCIPRIEEVCTLKFVPAYAPHQKNLPPGPVGSDDLVP